MKCTVTSILLEWLGRTIVQRELSNQGELHLL